MRYPYSGTESAGTRQVPIQQHADGRPHMDNTVLRFYSLPSESQKWGRTTLRSA